VIIAPVHCLKEHATYQAQVAALWDYIASAVNARETTLDPHASTIPTALDLYLVDQPLASWEHANTFIIREILATPIMIATINSNALALVKA